jgi:hypothetical protein
MDYQHYIADALDMVSAWEIPEDDFACPYTPLQF